jgi:hypothetical protein
MIGPEKIGPARTYVCIEPYTRHGWIAHCVDCKPEDSALPSLQLGSFWHGDNDREQAREAARAHAREVHGLKGET